MLMLGCLWASPALAAELQSIVTGQAVVSGRPADVRSTFVLADEQMYVWLHVTDAKVVELNWHRDGRFVIRNTLNATSSNWRTWMRRRFRPGDVGAWRIDVVADREAIGAIEFAVRQRVDDVQAFETPLPEKTPPEAPIKKAPPEPLALPSRTNTCRAVLNLRTSPEGERPTYAVAEVRFGELAEVEHAQGLIVRQGRQFSALGIRRRRHAQRAWDEMLSVPLGQTQVRRWQHLPGAQPLPAPPQLREDNRLTVLSVLGPYVGLDATLRSALGKQRVDNSRYLTVDATGHAVDMRTLIGPGLEFMVRNAGLPANYDYRQVALAPTKGLVAYLKGERIPMVSAPPAVRGFSPDAEGEWRDGRCALKLAGHRIAASVDDAPFREIRAPRLLPYALLGVYWLDNNAPSIMDPLRLAHRRLALHP